MKWLLIALVSLMLPSPSWAEFTFTDVQVPGASRTDPFGIDDRGDIVGTYEKDGEVKSFLFSDGQYSDLDLPGDAQIFVPFDISSRGVIVGSFDNPDSEFNAGFILDGENAQLFPDILQWSGINNKGSVVGVRFMDDHSDLTEAVLLHGKAITVVSTPPGLSSAATGINEKGTIVGFYETDDGTGTALIAIGFINFKGGKKIESLQHPSGSETFPTGINNAGEIVGLGGEGSFYYKDGKFTDITGPGISDVSVRKINNRGVFVGSYVKNNERLGFFARKDKEKKRKKDKPEQ